MRSAGIYLVQAEIGTCKLVNIPQGDITITLRVGKSSASVNYTQPIQAKQTNFNTILQLNVDNAGLQTQRCSITLTHNKSNEKKPLGIALISLPKDKNIIQNVYRLTQSQDKKSQLQAKIKISPLDSISSSLNKNPNLPLVSNNSIHQSAFKTDTIIQSTSKNQQSKFESKILRNDSLNKNQNHSGIKSISQIEKSQHIGDSRKALKGFKIKQNDKILSIPESQFKMIKDEKQAYYQLYQIEKTKSEAATKFISNIINKIGARYPDLISNTNDKMMKFDSIGKQKPVNKNLVAQQQAQMVSTLQQANRSLHRQNQQYKKIVEQLKALIVNQNKGEQNGLKIPQLPLNKRSSISSLDLYDIAGSNINKMEKGTSKQKRQVGNVLPSNILQDQKKASAIISPSTLKDIDLKKWLDLSIGQRNAIQKLLQNIPERSSQKDQRIGPSIQKLKKIIDKVFILFLNKKQTGKETLLAHKQEINRVIDELNG